VFDRSSLADVRQGVRPILYVLSADGREIKHCRYPEWKLNIRFKLMSVIVYILCIMEVHKRINIFSPVVRMLQFIRFLELECHRK